MSNLVSKPKFKHPILVEVLNAISHGLGCALAIWGLVMLILKAVQTGSAFRIVTFTIYGSFLVLFYLSSTLCHALAFTKAAHVFQIFDHAMIYLLIAATYLPYCLIAIRGWMGWTLFGIIMALAVGGIIYVSLGSIKQNKLSTLCYILMGWLCVIAIWPIFKAIGTMGTALLAAGGVTFTAGTIFYQHQSEWSHLIWHFFVILGTALMYFSIFLYL